MERRNLPQVLRDGLFPEQMCGYLPPWQVKRRHATKDVLLSMPHDDYEVLKRKKDTFTWFVRDYAEGACVYPFPATICREEGDDTQQKRTGYALVLYLSPMLERAAYDRVVAVIAHELAHIVLDHDPFPHQRDQDDAQEKEAWDRVCQWGFARETRKAKAVLKARETRRRKQKGEKSQKWPV